MNRYLASSAAHPRSVALLEDLSYVVLLLVATPLKYLAAMPMMVRLVGSSHGALFIWLGLLVATGLSCRGRPLGWAVRIMVPSLPPFGTFAIDRHLRTEIETEDY